MHFLSFYFRILKAFDTIPVDQCIDINTFAEQCGASCYMILCVLTVTYTSIFLVDSQLS